MVVAVIAVPVMQVAIVQIVDMAAVAHGRAAAAGIVPVGMVGMLCGGASSHEFSSSPCPRAADTAARPSAT